MASYTITIAPNPRGQVTVSTSDGHTCRTTTPLLTGARYWQQLGAPSSATITTVWSSASPEWTLRSTISHADVSLSMASPAADARTEWGRNRIAAPISLAG